MQAEWNADETYPEAGLFVKLDNPDAFKPTLVAIIDAARKMYGDSAVVDETDSGGQKFATLHFNQALPISPTITENGSYLGIFLTENQAIHTFHGNSSYGLLSNASFQRQIGNRRGTASQIMFLDTPPVLDHAYKTALSYASLIAMFNRDTATALQQWHLPPDVAWLAPVETWTCVSTSDDDGITSYSVSGIGNQAIYLGRGHGGVVHDPANHGPLAAPESGSGPHYATAPAFQCHGQLRGTDPAGFRPHAACSASTSPRYSAQLGTTLHHHHHHR